ncbi:putative nap family protein [Rosellinia necatrix]|uniref:Putative nap family protein n=1 Tax=Rosellinia necatrix TaxID=77044 RepID=A0A1W2TX19_ROSNE|nr:putative nap family protein [Rosellinia necatrix]
MVDAVEVEELSATYEGLAALEREFEDAETETIRQQYVLSKPLYEKRAKLVAKIPNFWPLVVEQAPPDVDQYIQPSDSALLLSSLQSISVSQFEIENGGKGSPRSIAIRLEFAENEYFEDKVLEKKFWYRRSRTGFAGLVSEPVPIKWKAGKDLTQGLLDLTVKVWEQDKKQSQANDASKAKKATKQKDWTDDQKALRKKIETLGLGGVSFFCWFGYRGADISAEESAAAVEEDKKRRAEGKPLQPDDEEDEEEDEDEDEEDEDEDPFALEIFPDGDELAIAFNDDLWPYAIKYFTQAQEMDAVSDFDFEDDDEEMEGEEESENEDDGEEAPPLKKRKA